MTKQQVIDILEAYKPSGNIYNELVELVDTFPEFYDMIQKHLMGA